MILLTGGSGFLGKHILRELLAGGRKVRVICRNPEKVDWSDFQGVDVLKGDILDPFAIDKAMEGVNEVIHCAALVSFVKRDRELMYKINVEGTANLVDACLVKGVEKFVHISSVAAIGFTSDGSPATEKTKWKADKTTPHYARTKYRAEKEVYRGIAEGMPGVICNPGVIIGPGADNKTTQQLFERIKKGLNWYAAGKNSFVGVRDCARAVKILLNSDLKNGERFILVSEILKYGDYLKMIAETVGSKPPQNTIPKFILRLSGPIAEFISRFTGKTPIISAETSRLVGTEFVYNGEKFSREMDFTYTPIKEVLKEIAEALKSKSHSG